MGQRKKHLSFRAVPSAHSSSALSALSALSFNTESPQESEKGVKQTNTFQKCNKQPKHVPNTGFQNTISPPVGPPLPSLVCGRQAARDSGLRATLCCGLLTENTKI